MFVPSMIALTMRSMSPIPFSRRPICMMFTLRYNDMLDTISQQKVLELVSANFTGEVCGQGLGMDAKTSDELDICLLSARLFPVREKQFGPSFAADKPL